jgi:hypothetical protein
VLESNVFKNEPFVDIIVPIHTPTHYFGCELLQLELVVEWCGAGHSLVYV